MDLEVLVAQLYLTLCDPRDLNSEDVNRKLQQDVHKVSDGSYVCCPEVDCGSLVLPVISALAWLCEQEQSSSETATGCLPASALRSLG